MNPRHRRLGVRLLKRENRPQLSKVMDSDRVNRDKDVILR